MYRRYIMYSQIMAGLMQSPQCHLFKVCSNNSTERLISHFTQGFRGPGTEGRACKAFPEFKAKYKAFPPQLACACIRTGTPPMPHTGLQKSTALFILLSHPQNELWVPSRVYGPHACSRCRRLSCFLQQKSCDIL